MRFKNKWSFYEKNYVILMCFFYVVPLPLELKSFPRHPHDALHHTK
jgi:hypothetical protein